MGIPLLCDKREQRKNEKVNKNLPPRPRDDGLDRYFSPTPNVAVVAAATAVSMGQGVCDRFHSHRTRRDGLSVVVGHWCRLVEVVY